MNPSMLLEGRPEALGDVPGVCALPLTRAVVQYRDVHEVDAGGGRIEDVGLALVVEGRFASSAECLDLGSGRLKVLDLSTELVVLDWAYEPTVAHIAELARRAGGEGSEELNRYAFRLALRVLERSGFGPLTRATFLRIGFRDICHDLDLHEETSIRIVLGPGHVTRAHLDYDACALVFRTASTDPDAPLEAALVRAFTGAELRRIARPEPGAHLAYEARYSLPGTLSEARDALKAMRRGLASLVARFEPARFRSVGRLVETFGARDTLAGLRLTESRVRAVRISPFAPGSAAVH